MNLLISIDQLGNAFSGGNPDSTISARVGYFSAHPEETNLKLYWKSLERLIDFSFKPLDGPNHCHQAYDKEGGKVYVKTGKDWMRFVLSFIIIGSCIGVIIPLVYLITFIFQIKPNPDNIDEVLKNRLIASRRELINVSHLVDEDVEKNNHNLALIHSVLDLANEVKVKLEDLV